MTRPGGEKASPEGESELPSGQPAEHTDRDEPRDSGGTKYGRPATWTDFPEMRIAHVVHLPDEDQE